MKKNKKTTENKNTEIDAELLRMYMMGAANPKNSDKYSGLPQDDVIDLHISDKKFGIGKPDNTEILFHQLGQLEKAIDTAIATGKFEIRVIHGIGKGKLKQEIYKLLEKHPHVKSFNNDYHSRYGYGSTIIHFY